MSTTQPTWQPISRLPLIAGLIDETLAGVEEQYGTLQEAHLRPHALDDAIIGRVKRVYGEQRDDLWLYQEQVRRWRATPLTSDQRREVERLAGQLAHLRATLDAILALADELAAGTIDRILGLRDEELGLAILAGQFRKPAPAPPPVDDEAIPSRVGHCPRCSAPATLVIFAGPVEAVAEAMAGPVAALDVPAWIVAPPVGPGAPAQVLQVHPTRRPLGQMTAVAFAALVDRVGADHCRPQPGGVRLTSRRRR